VTWSLVTARRAERDLEHLSDPLLSRVLSKLQQLPKNPWPAGVKKLQGGGFRIRVGDYRILYDVDTVKRQIVVLAVGHRREVYR